MAGLTGPLAPGMRPRHTHVLAVVGDTARLKLVVDNLQQLGYQVTGSTDPAAAMAGLLQDSLLGCLSFHVVMVDRRSEYLGGGGRAAAGRLFEFAVREPQLSAYVINEKDETFGPLTMEDLLEFMKPICNVVSNGPKSSEATPNGPYNASPSTKTSTITNFSFLGIRAGRRSKKLIIDTNSQEVEQDRDHAEMEEQQPSQKPKKARVVWTVERHEKFVAAIKKLPRGDVVPKKILELMKDPALTRENIASHLQKYRRSHSGTKHHMPTPQASFPSPNMSSQQQAPPTVMQLQSEFFYGEHLLFHMQTLKTMDKSNKFLQVDVPPKGMYPRDDDPKQNSVCFVGNSDDNSLHEDLRTVSDEEPDPSWADQILPSGRD